MAGIGKYKKGKAFTLKSGNKPMFKQMGSSPIKVAGAFIDGERATYEETRAAEEEGKDVRYTNKEEAKRTQEEISRLQKKADEEKRSTDEETRGKSEMTEALVGAEKSGLAQRKKWVRENKSSKADIEARKSDRAAQDELERAAINKKRKEEGYTGTPEQRPAWQKRQIEKDKAADIDTSKYDPKGAGISSEGHLSKEAQKKKEARKKAKKSPATLKGSFKDGKRTTEEKPKKSEEAKDLRRKKRLMERKKFNVGKGEGGEETTVKTKKKKGTDPQGPREKGATTWTGY